MTRITLPEITSWMIAFDADPEAPPPSRALARALETHSPRRLVVEVIRFPGRGAKVQASAHLDGRPALDALLAEGWRHRRHATAETFRRDGEAVLVIDESDFVTVEWSRELPEIPVSDGVESMTRIPSLRPFAGFVRGDAELVDWGIGHDTALGRLGLVKIHRDLGRTDRDEAFARSRGFTPTEMEGRWALTDPPATLLWVGGTLYGYVGPVPSVVGGWPGPAP